MCEQKRYRESLNQTVKLVTQTVADEFVKQQGADPNKFEIITDDKILHTNMLLQDDIIDELAEIIYNHVWIFLVNKSDTVFITSDSPFVKKANISHPFRSFSGLKSPGIEIAFPISPKYCLSIVEKKFIKILEHFDGKLMHASYENVIHYNSLQVINSYRFLYSVNNNFEMGKEILRDEPSLADPKRVRIEKRI